jgi:hypothetical protein
MKHGRYITLTDDQARTFWKVLDTDVKELLDAILEDDEKIIGIGSFGSPDPQDQRVLFIEKKNEKK